MKQKDILIILIFVFSLTMIWVGFNIYHSIRSSTISETTSKDISPITPSFDIKTIDKLKQRQKINPAFEPEQIIPTNTPTPTIEIISLPTSTSGAELTP